LIGLSIAATAPAQVALGGLIEVQESGSNVIATASGAFDTTGVTNYGTFSNSGPSNLAGSLGVARIGTFSNLADAYQLTNTFGTFGTLTSQFADLTTGTGFGVSTVSSSPTLAFGTPLFMLPTGYISGTGLFATATWNNSTIASLGLTPGTYTTLFNNQTVTLRILPGVPEPATWAMMLIGFGAIGAAMRRRNSRLALA
jgi:hypothetical protein